MVEEQLLRRGISDERVLTAMGTVARDRFVPDAERAAAYEDRPLPIGFDQTISQPYMVALVLEALALRGTETVLEIGGGSGYQAALLGVLSNRVYTVEIIPELADRAKKVLRELHYGNVTVLSRDGSAGIGEYAPYDAIVVAAAAPFVSRSLLGQLSPNGRLIAPVGERSHQQLVRIKNTAEGYITEALGACRFVPLVSANENKGIH